MNARERFDLALAELDEMGGRVPCRGHEEWTSEDSEDRRYAARLCAACPLVGKCAAVATENKIRFGVWGGIDCTAKTRRANA